MARSTSLSDHAFRALRSQKQAGESDSDVVLRLVRQATRKEKDPIAFFRNPPEAAWPPHKQEDARQKMREADARRMRDWADPGQE